MKHLSILAPVLVLAAALCSCSPPPKQTASSYRYAGTLEDIARQIDEVRPTISAPTALAAPDTASRQDAAPPVAQQKDGTAAAGMSDLNKLVDEIAADSRKVADERKREAPPTLAPSSNPALTSAAGTPESGWWYFTNRRAVRGGYEWDVWDKEILSSGAERRNGATLGAGTLRIVQADGKLQVVATSPAVREWVVGKLKLEAEAP